MKITSLVVSNFKKIQTIRIEPDTDRMLVLIAGNNAQGKSSALDALTTAFGGKVEAPRDPVRHGAESAEIEVRTDAGLIITRSFKPDGSTRLTVTTEHGKVQAPDAVLAKIIGSRFLDPLAILNLKPAALREFLLQLSGAADAVATLDGQRDQAYDTRTEINRTVKTAEIELAATQPLPLVPSVDVAALQKEITDHTAGLASFDQAQRETATLAERIANGKTYVADLQTQMAALQATLDKSQHGLAQLTAQHDDMAKALAKQAKKRADVMAKCTTAKAALVDASATNVAAARAADNHARIAKLQKQLAAQQVKADKLTAFIETIDQQKQALLAASPLQIAGFDPDALTLNGAPLAQASAAERFALAVQIALAAAPQLADVWVKDGALLDETSQAALLAACTAANVRLWLEIVGPGTDNAIVIEDGKIARGK